MKKELILKDLNDTKKLAKELARLAAPDCMLLLYGDLGTGKTTLTRFIAQELGEPPENVSSPTFSIIHEYNTAPPIAHVDLYRLGPGADIYELGLDEYLERGFFIIIEWAEYLSDVSEIQNLIELHLKFINNDKRKAVLIKHEE